MTKRTLYIIICLLLFLDAAAIFIYIVSNTNRDGKNPIEFSLGSDSLPAEMADTLPDYIIADRFDTIERKASFVSLDKVSNGKDSKRMTCSVKFKLMWPKSINNHTNVRTLETELMEKMLGRVFPSIKDAMEYVLENPSFVKRSTSFSRVSGDFEGTDFNNSMQHYRVFPYISTNYLLEMVVLVEKFDGHKLMREMGVVHFDRVHNKLITIDKIFDLSQSNEILALVNQNIERVKVEKMNNLIHETSVLPMEFLLGRKSVIFYLPDGTIAPVGSGLYEVSVPNADLSPYFTDFYNELIVNDSHFTTYGFMMW